MSSYSITHLQQLEAESIHIIREVAAEFERPVMLYSVGKDSAVMLHLACRAFRPGPLPMPLMHVDTTFKFAEMIRFRDAEVQRVGAGSFLQVYLSAPVDVCRGRKPDTYARADTGEIKHFSGVTAPYEAPASPDLELPTHEIGVDECVDQILAALTQCGIIGA